jgi:hypothetical protein
MAYLEKSRECIKCFDGKISTGQLVIYSVSEHRTIWAHSLNKNDKKMSM